MGIAMLSMQTRYALKAMIELALIPQDERLSASEIAAKTGISLKFLEATLGILRRSDLIESKLGKNGGYRLTRSPEETNFAEIIRVTNGPIALLPCVSKNFYKPCADCQDESSCRLRMVMNAARNHVLTVLENVSLADAVKQTDDVERHLDSL